MDLKNTTHYNNCTGTMVKKDKDRYFVVLDGFLPTKILKVKLSNLKIIKLKVTHTKKKFYHPQFLALLLYSLKTM